ncbi:MAG: hypothetical protein NXH91_16435 [Phyllobacteriaceae bacterium]|jgi:hypothetical protein|nr:hypothetical protein [Phyllobacteriaceae bacterium]
MTIALLIAALAVLLLMDFRVVRALYKFASNRRALNPEENRNQ